VPAPSTLTRNREPQVAAGLPAGPPAAAPAIDEPEVEATEAVHRGGPTRGRLGIRMPSTGWIHRANRSAPWAMLLVVLALTAAAWRLVDQREREAGRADLAVRGIELATTLASRMRASEQMLRGAAARWATAPPVERDDWSTFVSALALDALPGIEGVGWAARVEAAELARLELAVRAQGPSDYAVFPTGNRDSYAPVVYLEPAEGRNRRALGFDLYGDPIRRRAMDTARDTGRASLTAPVVLASDGAHAAQPGVLANVPVYRPGVPPQTTAQRREAMVGWVYAPFRAGDLVRSARGDGWDDLRLDVRDGLDGASLFEAGEPPVADERAPVLRLPVRMIDRDWSISIHPVDGARTGIPLQASTVAWAGGIGSLLLFGIVWSLANTRSRALAIAGRMTAALRRANETLEARALERTDALHGGNPRLSAFNDRLRAVNAAFGAIGATGVIDDRLGVIAAHLRGIVAADLAIAVAHRPGGAGAPAVGLDASPEVPPAAREGWRQAARDSDRSGEAPVRPDTPDAHRTQAPLLDAHGRVRGYLLLIRAGAPFDADDVAVLSQFALLVGTSLSLNETLASERQARAEAERADRAKDEMLAVVSHELRTPLNAIQGWLHVLRRRRADDGALLDRAIDVIQRNLDTQVQLVDDLLDTARIVSGKLRLELRPLDLVPLLQVAADAVRPLAESKRITLSMSIADEPFQTVGDPSRLEQVVWNLLSNAVKFTPLDGRISVRLERLGWLAQLEVEDTGQGIEPSFLPHVFDRFRQADSSSTRAAGGLGLGLALVQHIVQAHGGQVMVRSEGPGRGSCFTVSLPLGMAGVPDWATAPLDDAALAGFGAIDWPGPLDPLPADDAPQPLLGLSVLVVEDHDDSRALLAEFLAGQGAQVTVAADAREAMQRLRDTPPDPLPGVLLCDVALPGESGHELLSRIRTFERSLQRPGDESIVAFAISAFTRDEDRQASLAAGFTDHLSKPLSQPALVERLQRLRDRMAGRPTSAPPA